MKLKSGSWLIQQFANDSCKCDFGPNRSPCCTTITIEHFRSVDCQMAEPTHDMTSWIWVRWWLAASLRRHPHTVGRRGARIHQKKISFPSHHRLLGDKGGKSFKTSFQIVNTHHPNPPSNTCVFSLFEASDIVQGCSRLLWWRNRQAGWTHLEGKKENYQT